MARVTLRDMGQVARNVHSSDTGAKAFFVAMWLVVFAASYGILHIIAELIFQTSLFEHSPATPWICLSTGLVSVPLTIYLIIRLLINRERAKRQTASDNLLRPSLELAQSYLFLTDMDVSSLRKHITEEMGISEHAFQRESRKNMTDLVFQRHGFGIDHRFESADLVMHVAEQLAPIGISVSQDMSPGRYDTWTDNERSARRTNVIVQGEAREFEFTDPFSLARGLNSMLAPHGYRLVMNELDSDTYEFLLVRAELARRMLLEKKLAVL